MAKADANVKSAGAKTAMASSKSKNAPSGSASLGAGVEAEGGDHAIAESTGAAAPAKKGKKAPINTKDKRAVCDQYMPYVRSIAGKVKKTVAKEIEFDDLVEYGMIGLLEAADRYDPEHGANFMTFAYYRIRGAIYDGLRGMGWMSRSEYAKARFEERANEYLAEVAQAEAAGEDIPDNPFEMAVQDLASAVQGLAAVYLTSLDGTEGLQIEDTDPGQEDALGLDQARNLVRETIKKLNDQERTLLELYYYKEMSLQEVGERLGLSKSWTSRLHARVIDKLHRLLEDELG